jgi:mannan endo-1,4-beta-mannosidase
MRLRTRFLFWFIGLLILVAENISAQKKIFAPGLPTDPAASPGAVSLYRTIQSLQKNKQVLIGHQDALAYGVGWKQTDGEWKNDFEESSGEFPGLVGFDLGELELDQPVNLDKVPFDQMRKAIQECARRGSIITLSWHGHNPFNGKNAWDTTDQTFPSVLPGGEAHPRLQAYMKSLAGFMKTLKDDKGQLIPILFRPYHELTGNWFWWCTNSASPQQFTELWKWTHQFFRSEGLHNLIWVYNVAWFNSGKDVLRYFPGKGEADIISYDHYAFDAPANNARYQEEIRFKNRVMDSLSRQLQLPWAIAETGLERIPDSTWFTSVLAPILQKPAPAFVLFWRNAGLQENGNLHYYVPYKGHPAAGNFRSFIRMPFTVTLQDLNQGRKSKSTTIKN